MSTASQVKSRLDQSPKHWKKGGNEYLGPAPSEIRTGSDGMSFHVEFNGEEFGRWNDFKGEGGSLYTLAQKLGIALPKRVAGRETMEARSLADYERDKGFPAEYLSKRGWVEGTHQNRPCIFIPVDDESRQVRYLDGEKPKFKWETKRELESDGLAKLSFYGSKEAKRLVNAGQLKFMVWANGAGSVEVMQRFGIPAFAVVGGENNIARKVYTERVLSKFNGTIFIALDCDKAGREGAEKLAKLLGERGLIIDLGGSDGFDGADFANLWGEQSLARLIQLAEESHDQRPPRTAAEAANAVIAQIEGKRPIRGRIIPQPFTLLHRFGGGAYTLDPDLMTGIVALSGHGKTAWWQSWIKILLESPRKWGIIVDSREFTPEADSIRRMQGEAKQQGLKISRDIIQSHLVWQQEEQENIEPRLRFGKQLRPEMLEELKQLNAFMQMSWNGALEFAEEHAFIEDTLEYMKRRTLELRESGERADLWVFDYLTLYRCKPEMMEGVGKNIYGVITQAIKDAARAMHVHVILMLQPNKSPSADAIAKNERLKITDIGYVNQNDFNCVLGLNILYGTQAKWETGLGSDGKGTAWVIAGYEASTGLPVVDKAMLKDGSIAATVEVLKNTNGVNGVIPMKADFANIQWLDSGWDNSDLRLPLDAGFRDRDE